MRTVSPVRRSMPPSTSRSADRHGDHGDRQRREQLEDERGQERDPQHAHGRVAVLRVDLGHLRALHPLAAERLERGEPGHHVEEVARQDAEGRPLLGRRGLRVHPDEDHEHGDERRGDADDHRREQVLGEDRDADREGHDGRDDQLRAGSATRRARPSRRRGSPGSRSARGARRRARPGPGARRGRAAGRAAAPRSGWPRAGRGSRRPSRARHARARRPRGTPRRGPRRRAWRPRGRPGTRHRPGRTPGR